jgi:predicted CDP-diglyceride synthetase/phosphatidate cytidylyltransferase
MVCVYFVSYVPALLMLRIPAFEQQNAKLVLFLVLVVQLSDVLQYVWGKSIGTRPIAPSISPNKTWEGCVGGIVCATAIGAAIWWATPFGPVVSSDQRNRLQNTSAGVIHPRVCRGRPFNWCATAVRSARV